MDKYVFVTGGVVSGLGKGITRQRPLEGLLKARGYQVTMQKFDPYINMDPGTMNPISMEKYLLQKTEQKQIWILVTTNVLSMKIWTKIPM